MSIYLDFAATAPVLPAAAAAALAAMTETFGNPSSVHALGQTAKQHLEDDRISISSRLGCTAEELYFTSGGTESNNWAIFSGAKRAQRLGRHLITSSTEHSSILEATKALEQSGWSVTYLQPDKQGYISPAILQNALRTDTALVSMMLVNNETGVRAPIEEYVQLSKANNLETIFHCDAVQAFLKVPFSPSRLGVDLLSISAHKLGGPKGIGALYLRKNLSLPPLFFGGGQEASLRPGTEATAQIAAFAAACTQWDGAALSALCSIKSYAIEALSRVSGLEWVSSGDAPHICAFSLPGYPGEMLVRDLSDRGIFISSGSACHRGKPSHVFASMGLPKRTLMGMLRVSFAPTTLKTEIDALCAALESIQKERIAIR